MRTDAKIGFAIGGVLLAVLIVYAIVIPRHNKKAANNTVSLVTPPASTVANDPVVNTPPTMVAPDTTATSTVVPPSVTVTPPPTKELTPGPITGGPLADNNSGPTLPNSISEPKELPKPGVEKSPKFQDGVYLPDGAKPKPVHSHQNQPADEAPSVIATDHSYTIKSGQTLSKIAYEVYGNSRYWVAIQRENKGLDPNHLKVGWKINLPDISPIPGPITVAEEQSPAEPIVHASSAHISTMVTDAHTYIVKSGDNLYGIARRILGSGKKSEAIYALNKVLIGPDKAKLKLGMVLKLPDADRTALAN